jgi:squalene-hopene/tetraprenyl-beta-curcumene cyclase
MLKKSSKRLLSLPAILLTVKSLVIAVPGFSVQPATETAKPLRDRVKEAISLSVRWLGTQQQSDGSFVDRSIVNQDGSIGSPGINPALTALVVYGIAKSPLADEMLDTPMIRRAVAYIKSNIRPDGGIYKEAFAATYQTSVCLCALASLKDPANARILAASQEYLKSSQAAEPAGLSRTDPSYGGWGYSHGSREADLSNLQFALTALKESGLSSDDAVWEKALQFVERCQNLRLDGGFIYRPGESKAGIDDQGNYRSYMSMTYAGLLSFIYCSVDKEDPRVRGALQWLQKNYSLEENLPIGKRGLYYSYHTMAKALAAFGERTFVDSRGTKHDWFQELASTLLKKQSPEGFWVNTSSAWLETDKVLVTAYTILALSEGLGQANPF